MPVRNAVPADLEPIERASRDEVEGLQLERLKWSLQHAYDNVAHYRCVFDEAKVHPSHLKQLSDLARFPFTTKKDLRDKYRDYRFANAEAMDLTAVPAGEPVAAVLEIRGGRAAELGIKQGDVVSWRH